MKSENEKPEWPIRTDTIERKQNYMQYIYTELNYYLSENGKITISKYSSYTR